MSMPLAVQCSPSTKLESGYPQNFNLFYTVHSGGQNLHLSPLSIARTRLCTPIHYLLKVQRSVNRAHLEDVKEVKEQTIPRAISWLRLMSNVRGERPLWAGGQTVSWLPASWYRISPRHSLRTGTSCKKMQVQCRLDLNSDTLQLV
jgi:hypothetical protein